VGTTKNKIFIISKNIPEAVIDRFLDKYDKEFFKLKIKEYLKKHKVEISNLSYEEKIYWAKHLQQKGYDIEIINELIFS